QNWKMKAGVDILKSEKPEILPWVWRQGGENSEEGLARWLGDRAKGRSQELGLHAGEGSVALSRIPILPDSLDGFDLDREPLVKCVKQGLGTLTKKALQPQRAGLYP